MPKECRVLLKLAYEVQKPSPRGVLEKGVLKSFAKFTGKQLCQSLIFHIAAGLKSVKKKPRILDFFNSSSKELFQPIVNLFCFKEKWQNLTNSAFNVVFEETFKSVLCVYDATATYTKKCMSVRSKGVISI